MKKFLLIIILMMAYTGFSQSVTTNAATNVAQTTATLKATGASLNNTKSYRVDFYYDVVSGGFSNLISSNTISGATSGTFTANITGLNPDDDYYFTAYLYEFSAPPPSWNYKGAGAEVSLHTLSVSVPTVTIPASINSITNTTASNTGNNAVSENGATITDKGIVWHTASSPTIANSSFCSGATGIGTFNGSLTGLTSGTTYYVRAYATNSAGTGYSATERVFITNCDAPTVSAATELKGDGFKANWAATTGAQKYFLDVSTASDFSSFVASYSNLDVGAVTSYTVTGLSPLTTYYYRVRAFNDGGADGDDNLSSNSAAQMVQTINASPTTQASGLVWSGDEGSGAMEFSWTNGNGAARLMVMKEGSAPNNPQSGFAYSANSVFGDGDDVGGSSYVVFNAGAKSTSNVTVTGLSDDTDYYFKVCEYNGTGTSSSYNIADDAGGFEDGNLGNSRLPVSLLSFNALEKESGVELNFSTATELNNDYFTLERSMDTENFELVTRIQGAGNSNIETKYHYLDIKVAEGDVYYRLKQFDFDGKETILSLVSVNMSSNGDLIGSVIVNDNSLLVEMGQLDQTTVVSLLDASGKLIQMVSKNDLNTNQIQFNMSGLSHGMYIIRIEQANIMESVKVIF